MSNEKKTSLTRSKKTAEESNAKTSSADENLAQSSSAPASTTGPTQADIAAAEALLAQKTAELAALEKQVGVFKKGDVTMFGVTVKEGTVLHDPFHTKNPMSIKAHPPGMRLQWCNPVLRERIGWKGWEPVKHDDEIGRDLETYLPDPPAKMIGAGYSDNFVRRGPTAILCKLPEEIWLVRQIAVEEKSADRVAAHSSAKPTLLRGDGSVQIIGSGAVDDDPRNSQVNDPRLQGGETMVRRNMG